MDTMQILLDMSIPDMPEKEIKLKRLSELSGKPVVFKLKALPYNRSVEIGKMDEVNVHCCLAGVVEPNFKDTALLEHFKAPTPAELVKKLLLPGEIEDISREIEKLSGYRVSTIETVEEVKKN